MRLFDNPFSTRRIFERISCMQWLFGLLSKLKRSETSFWCTFSAWIFHKNVPYWILYQWTKFQCHHTLFLSHNIKQIVLLRSYLDSWWRHKLSDFSWINLYLKQWLTGKKRGAAKIWISRERKELFRWNEKHFS